MNITDIMKRLELHLQGVLETFQDSLPTFSTSPFQDEGEVKVAQDTALSRADAVPLQKVRLRPWLEALPYRQRTSPKLFPKFTHNGP